MKKILIVIFAALFIAGCTSGHKKHSKRKVTRLTNNKGYFYRDDRGTTDVVSDDLFWIYYYNMTINDGFVSSTPSGSWSNVSYINFANTNAKDLENEENNENEEVADLSEDPEGNTSLEEETESNGEETDNDGNSDDGDSGDSDGGDASGGGGDGGGDGGDGGGGDGGGGGE